MKCARCGHDSKYPERVHMTCPGCRGKFAFEPRNGDPINDVAWKRAIDWVGSDGTVAFTLSNLYHAVARRVTRGPRVGKVFGLVTVGSVGGHLLTTALEVPGLSLLLVPVVIIAGLVSLVRGRFGSLSLTQADFLSLHRRWVDAHGVPSKLIPPPVESLAPLDPALVRELESYSFDRAVICDRPDTVDLLLANDFHFENNCAILSVGGHPRNAFDTVRAMLRRNPRLEVFVLHDATPGGCRVAYHVRHDPEWFGGTTAQVFDVALRPHQAKRQPKLHWRVTEAVGPHPALSDAEGRWLSRRRMEIAAFRPEQIIKRLFRAMNQMPAVADAADGGCDVIWTTEASTSDGGADSFG